MKGRGSPIRSVATRMFRFNSSPPPKPFLGATLDDLSIDDNLSQLERLVKYSTSNIALQRLVHTKMIGDTSRQVGYDTTVKSIIPILHTLCTDSECVIRQHLSWQIRELAEVNTDVSIGENDNNKESSYSLIIETLLPMLATLLADRETEVRSAAGEALVGIACIMDPTDLGQHVLTILLNLAHDFDEEELRITAAGLLNDLAETLGEVFVNSVGSTNDEDRMDLCRQFVMADTVSLGEDPSHRVRKATALNLYKIAETVGPPYTYDYETNAMAQQPCVYPLEKERLLPTFICLTKDNMYRVRKACTDSLVNFSKALGPEVSSIHLTEVMLRLGTDNNKWVRSGALQCLGPFISTLKGDNIGIDEKLISLFITIARDADSNLRQYCAFSFPAVVLTVGPSQWQMLRCVYQELMCDDEIDIRRTLACSIHEVAQILTADQVEQDLLEYVENLMLDVDKVRTCMAQHIHVIFSIISAEHRAEMLPLLLRVLEDSNHYNWRLRDAFAAQLPRLIPLFPASTVFDVILPLTFALLEDPVFRVRTTTYRAIATLHACLSVEQREGLVRWISNLSTHSGSSFRQTYIYIVQQLIETMPEEVIDVRIALARGLANRTYPQWFAELPDVQTVTEILRNDENIHVRGAMLRVSN